MPILLILLVLAPLQNVSEYAHHVCIKHLEAPKAYPSLARMAQLQGAVTAVLHVDSNGTVTGVETSGGHQILQDATVRSLKGWTFACTDCSPNTSFKHTLTFHYKLLPERSSFNDARVEMDLPSDVSITARRPEMNTSRSK